MNLFDDLSPGARMGAIIALVVFIISVSMSLLARFL